jgi:hypothetical protein
MSDPIDLDKLLEAVDALNRAVMAGRRLKWCPNHHCEWGYNPNCGWSPQGVSCEFVPAVLVLDA